MAKKVIALPEWAQFKLDGNGKPVRNGKSLVILVDTHVAYPYIIAEYRERYKEQMPGEFQDADGKVKKEWVDCLGDCDPNDPSGYWVEVCVQTAKMDLQIACGTFALNISLKDPGKKYRIEDLKKGRDPAHAVGGGIHVKGTRAPGREARDHFKRLRGFVPA